MHTIIKYESPKFLLIQLEEAKEGTYKGKRGIEEIEKDLDAMIRLIYVNSDTEKELAKLKDHILSTCERKTS